MDKEISVGFLVSLGFWSWMGLLSFIYFELDRMKILGLFGIGVLVIVFVKAKIDRKLVEEHYKDDDKLEK